MAGELPGLPGKNFEENVFERILSKTKKTTTTQIRGRKEQGTKKEVVFSRLTAVKQKQFFCHHSTDTNTELPSSLCYI